MNQQLRRVRKFLGSPSAHLAMTYLLIIMAMSIGFSFVFYHTSAHELGRQVPPNNYFGMNNDVGNGAINSATGQLSPDTVGQFLRERAQEGRNELLTRLIWVNALALVVGSGLSYYLARRSLRPIEAAMEAQSQFVSDASHELRTPLTAIQASNEVALRNNKLTLAQAREVITQNSEDVLRLKDLSEGLLNLARQNKKILSSQPLADIISDALGQVVAPATAKQITVNDQASNLSVIAERHSLQQVLVILLDNAIKYSPAKSTITLDTTTRGKFVYLHVRDQGIGIRASDLPHIFRRFYRADAARTGGTAHDGYGLGLAIAKQIMQQIDGNISVQSELGKGSVFTVKLPAANV